MAYSSICSIRRVSNIRTNKGKGIWKSQHAWLVDHHFLLNRPVISIGRGSSISRHTGALATYDCFPESSGHGVFVDMLDPQGEQYQNQQREGNLEISACVASRPSLSVEPPSHLDWSRFINFPAHWRTGYLRLLS